MSEKQEEPTAAIHAVENPELVTVGNRTVSTKGWKAHLVKEHLLRHLKEGPSRRWCSVGCMASTMFQRKSKENIQKVRRRVADVFKALLMEHGLFLTIDYATGKGTHGEIVAMKLYKAETPEEIERASRQIDRMKMKKEVSSEVWERALELIHKG